MRRMIDTHVHIDRWDWSQPRDENGRHPRIISPEAVLEQMDASGVERAVIMQHPETPMNDEVSDTVQAHPDRIRGAMIVRIEEDQWRSDIEYAHERGLTSIKVDMYGTERLYPGTRLDGALMQQIYGLAEELGIVVTIDPFRIQNDSYQPDEIGRMVEKFSGLRWVICHLGYCQAESLAKPELRARWDRMAALASYDNLWFDISAIPDMFETVEKYPWPSGQQLVKHVIDSYGADKVMFGSDILGELRQASYPELIDMYEKCDLFSEAEKDLMFFGNADRVYFGADR